MKIFERLTKALLIVSMSILPLEMSARWEQIYQLSCARAFLLTTEGVMLAADKISGGKGGIYVSEDYGESWTKADVADHHYTQFKQIENAIFALGEGGYIARSTDGGRQWEEIFYCEDYLDDIPWGDVESCDCYGMAVHGGRIYIANFVYMGVMYTDDMGDSWHTTSIRGMEIDDEGVITSDYLYNILSLNESLYAFGINKIYRYDETEDCWVVTREGTNFLTILTMHHGQLVAGRGTPNDSFDVNFLEKTSDGVTWEPVGRPIGFVHNNIRGLAADESILVAGTANNGIFVTSDFGDSWEEITEGMPLYDGHKGVYLWPVTLQTDDQYIYAALYHPSQYDFKDSGIWRYPKASLAGLATTISDRSLGLSILDRTIKVNNNVDSKDVLVQLYASSGNKILESNKSQIDVSTLPVGLYLYRLTAGDDVVTGKLILK